MKVDSEDDEALKYIPLFEPDKFTKDYGPFILADYNLT